MTLYKGLYNITPNSDIIAQSLVKCTHFYERTDFFMASIRKRGDSYQITVSCGRDSQYRKISRTTTYKPELYTAKGHPKTEKTLQKELEAFAADFERQVLNGSYTEGNKITLEKYSLKYLQEYAEQYQAPKTLESTRNYIRLFVKDFGYMTLDKLTPMFLQEYVNKMQQEKKRPDKPETISYSTVKRRMAVLSAMLSQAVRWNLIPNNPMARVRIMQEPLKDPDAQHASEKKIMCFTQQQAELFLKLLDDPLMYRYGTRERKDNTGKIYSVQEYQTKHTVPTQLKLFFYLAIFTGCRRGELISLKWSDINFESSSLLITKSTSRVKGEIYQKGTKRKRAVKEIAVPAAVTDLARKWKTEQLRQQLSIGSKWEGDDFIFIQWNGRQMGLETPYQAMRRIIKNYNDHRSSSDPELPMIPLNGLRHTAATLLITAGVDIRTVSGRLGHAKTSTTLNFYTEFLKEMDHTASDKLETLLLKEN